MPSPTRGRRSPSPRGHLPARPQPEHGLGRPRDAAALLERTADSGAPAAESTRWRLALGSSLLFSGLPDRALDTLSQIEDLHREPGGDALYANSLWLSGRMSDLQQWIRDIPAEEREPWLMSEESSCLLFTGHLGQAVQTAEAALAALGPFTIDTMFGHLIANLVLGAANMMSGQAGAAARCFRVAAAPIEGAGLSALPHGMLAGAAALAGDLPTARASLSVIESVIHTGPSEPGNVLGETGLAAMTLYAVAPGRALTDLAHGKDPAEVSRLLRSATDRLGALGQHLNQAWALNEQTFQRAVHDIDVVRLAEAAPIVGGELLPLWVAHARAVADGDIDALATVADDLAQRGFIRDAVHAAWSAWTFALDGSQARAAAAARVRLDELVALTDWHNAFRPPSDDLRELTARELQIAQLAGDGRASKEIAAELFLSARTVDNNLQRVFRKLGVSGRQALRSRL